MIDIALLIGRILLVAILFVFLFAVMRTGIGLVKGQSKKFKGWAIRVETGPKQLRGLKINVAGPIIVGRSPGADVVIDDNFVSGRHLKFALIGNDLVAEDLASTNGTLLDGTAIQANTATRLADGSVISIGDVDIKVIKG